MRKFKITVEGRSYEVVVEAEDGNLGSAPVQMPTASAPVATFSSPASAAAPATAPAAPVASAPVQAPKGANDITSPLAGTVVSISVKVGDQIADGAEVLVLEAMKMNTPIRALKGGKVTAVHIIPGTSVQEGQVLVSIG